MALSSESRPSDSGLHVFSPPPFFSMHTLPLSNERRSLPEESMVSHFEMVTTNSEPILCIGTWTESLLNLTVPVFLLW